MVLRWKGFRFVLPLFCRGVEEQLRERRGSRMVGFQLPGPPSASSPVAKKALVGPAERGLANAPDRKQAAEPVRNMLKAGEGGRSDADLQRGGC